MTARPDDGSPVAHGRIAIRRALVSVYDKTGLEDLAAACTTPASRWSPPAARRR